MMRAFGSKELIGCVEFLGFIKKSIAASHAKYEMPKGRPCPSGERPFMIVQLEKKGFDKHSANRYIGELKRKGFSKEEIEAAFND